MRKVIVILIGLAVIASLGFGCTTTHYTSPTCPTMEAPPNFNDIAWVKIIITNPDTGKEIIYYAIPGSEVMKESLNVERAREYIYRAYELNRSD